MAANRAIAIIVFLLAIVECSWAQRNRYMVFFTDKDGTPYSVTEPSAFLSPDAIERRIRHGVPVSEQDLPVNPTYISAISATGADVFFKTRWLNGVLVQTEPENLDAIESLSFVERVELVAPDVRLSNTGRRKSPGSRKSARIAEVTDTQLHMLGIDEMHEMGYHGEGILIALFDSGYQGVDATAPFEHVFAEGRIDLVSSKDFVYNSNNVFQYDDHGTEVLSVIAAYQPGVFTGGAYKATFQLYVTEEIPTEYRIEEYNWLFAAERADSSGVHIIHSSLGYNDFDQPQMDYQKSEMNGAVAVVSRAAQWAADRGIIVIVSAGNEGNNSWRIITAPADAVDVLAVASVDANGARASSSSTGPAADMRVKPDIAAMGVATSVIERNGSVGKASGTSLAAPLITSLAAGVLQMKPDFTNIHLLDVIRKSASQAGAPDEFLGYGIPHFRAIVNYLEAEVQPEEFAVFPNPFSEGELRLVIKPKDPSAVTDCEIELVNAEGRRIYYFTPRFSWFENTFSPEFEGLSSGIYFLRILSGGKRFVFKVVRQ